MSIELKTDAQLALMRRAGLVVAEGLAAMEAAAKPGVSTAEVDRVARQVLQVAGASSNFLNYGADVGPGFPGVACISVNDELLHGVPGGRRLAEGDLVSIDFGAVVEGWHGDAARSFCVGAPRSEDVAMIEAAREAFWAGVAAFATARRVADISRAIARAIPSGYGVIRDYTGHGIGSAMHMAPDVPNYISARPTAQISDQMTLAIEPMLTLGGRRTRVLEDEWTVVSADGSRGAHWENTVARTCRGIWVLTQPDGGRAELAERGIPYGGPEVPSHS